MQDTKTGFQKYVFKGNAVALSGSIRKPYFQDLGTHAAISALAGSAGYIAASSRDFALQKDVTYDYAESEIRAERRDPICQMVMRTTITNLRVGPRIAVEGVVAQLRARYDIGSFPDRKMARLSPAGSTIRNLSIDGEVREVELPPAFRMDPKEEEEFLNGGRDDDERCYPGNIPTPFYIEGLGTIFIAEWTWKHPLERHRQSLCMLRLALGSEFGAEVDIGCCSGDGNGWPPFGL
jgi:hypothetical protein